MEIPIISESRRYWLVRTNSGRYYSEFFHGKFVGVGWDAVSADALERDDEALREMFVELYPQFKQPMYAVHQMRRFAKDLRPNDVVLIPSESSAYVTFGRIASDVYEVNVSEDDILEGRCPWTKRRRVEWLKTVERLELDPFLYRLLNSHHPVTQADDYGSYIDRTLHGFFRKGDTYHLVVHVERAGGIPATVLPSYLSALLELVELFNQETDSSLSTEEIQLKINVQSPGPIELISGGFALVLIGIVGIILVGGKVRWTREALRATFTMESESLLDKLSNFLDAAHRRRQEDRQYEALAVKVKELSEKLEARYPAELGLRSTHPNESMGEDDTAQDE